MDQLRSLRVFAQVIKNGSFAAAARTLDLAPAVVTRAISDLEDHLGARLINRTTRQLVLTEVGETYLQSAKQVLSDLDQADALTNYTNSEPSGSLRILCPPAFATHQLVKHLPEFCKRYPRIHLELATPGPVSVADENFDISILSIGQQKLEGDFVVRELALSTFVICAAPGYLDRRGRPQQPSDLMSHDGLIPAVAATRRELTLFRTVPKTAKGNHETVTLATRQSLLSTSQLEVLYAAAVAEMGIAGLPSFMVADALRSGSLERVLPEWTGGTLQLYAAMPTRKHLPARTRAFMDFLIERFGGRQDDPWLPSAAQ